MSLSCQAVESFLITIFNGSIYENRLPRLAMGCCGLACAFSMRCPRSETLPSMEKVISPETIWQATVCFQPSDRLLPNKLVSVRDKVVIADCLGHAFFLRHGIETFKAYRNLAAMTDEVISMLTLLCLLNILRAAKKVSMTVFVWTTRLHANSFCPGGIRTYSVTERFLEISGRDVLVTPQLFNLVHGNIQQLVTKGATLQEFEVPFFARIA